MPKTREYAETLIVFLSVIGICSFWCLSLVQLIEKEKMPNRPLDDVHQIYRWDSSGATTSPDLGLGEAKPDPSSLLRGFASVDPGQPALPPYGDDDGLQIFRDIRRYLSLMVPTAENPPVFDKRYIGPLAAGAGAESIRSSNDFRHVLVSESPRVVRLYAGAGQADLIAAIPANQSAVVKWPMLMDGVTVEWEAGAAGDIIRVIMSSEEIDVRVF